MNRDLFDAITAFAIQHGRRKFNDVNNMTAYMAPELDDKAHADLIQRVADKVNDIYKDVLETYNIGYNN